MLDVCWFGRCLLDSSLGFLEYLLVLMVVCWFVFWMFVAFVGCLFVSCVGYLFFLIFVGFVLCWLFLLLLDVFRVAYTFL